MILVALAAQAADLATFLVGYEIAIEGNPFMAVTVGALGPLGIVAIKCAGLAVIFAALSLRPSVRKPVLVAVAAVGAFGAVMNTIAIT